MKTIEKVTRGKPSVDLIVVTMDSGQVFLNWLNSVFGFTSEPFRLVIVNNGKQRLRLKSYPYVHYIDMDENKGWTGGVNAGLKWCLENSDAPFVCWMNDDTQVLDHDYGWLTKMIYTFQAHPKVGAVGPMSNRVMGKQSSNFIGFPPMIEAVRLSGMCFLTKKDIVREIGLLDESLPGGDDLDYSLRLRNAGYKLAICRRTFILHHYAMTGRRVHGEYWDSQAHTEAINTAIIRKHGLKKWFYMVNDWYDGPPEKVSGIVEIEEKAVLDDVRDELEHGTVLDLGCGGKKIHPKLIGVDLRKNGELGVGSNVLHPAKCDVTCDVLKLEPFEDESVDAIIAKHLLEHVMDIPAALREWHRVLKPGGKLIVVCPDYRFCESMAVDPSHVIAMTPETCKSWFKTVGGFDVTFAEHLPGTYVFKLTAEKTRIFCSCHPELKTVGAAP